jgi:hypothetical protein
MFNRFSSILFATLMYGSGMAYADSSFHSPIYEPIKIVELTEKYLMENRELVEWCSYSLAEIRFWYMRGKWYIDYDCLEKRPGYYFTIEVTNEKLPQFTYIPD